MRIWPDPVTGRNRYGTLTKPAPDEISFSSTTASNISPDGFAAANRALGRLFGTASEPMVGPDQWFDEIRGCIVALLGLSGAEAVLAASGTDAEVLTLGLVAGLAARPITNIFIAPDETGNGVPLAAAGRHFSSLTALGETVTAGSPIEGFYPDRIDVRTIAIRDEAGRPRDAEAMDPKRAVMVEQELRRGRDVLLHVLDASKTGLMAVTRQTARSLAGAAPGRVRVVIDACQLRYSTRAASTRPRRWLHGDGDGVEVCRRARLSPAPCCCQRPIAEEVAARGNFPAGLSDYSAALDWPAALRHRLGFSFKSEANIGLGLRWVAALDGIAALSSVSEPARALIIDYFARRVVHERRWSRVLRFTPMMRMNT